MLCLVCYLFVISTSVIDCLGRFVPEMTYYVSSGTLNLAQLNFITVNILYVNPIKQLLQKNNDLPVIYNPCVTATYSFSSLPYFVEAERFLCLFGLYSL